MLNEQQIVDLLAKTGNKGLTCKKLAKHLYNANNSLFEAASFDDIYRELQAYLNRKTKERFPYIEKTGEWGYYRLNDTKLRNSLGWMGNVEDPSQEEAETQGEKKPTTDPKNYPSLFD